MIIKICGIKTLEAAKAAAEHGADLIGFVFAESRRRIEPEAARAIAAAVPGIGKVGVFVNAPLDQVRDIAKLCQLDYVQLHGDESPEYCAQVGYPVIKAVRVTEDGVYNDAAGYKVDWLLFDTFAAGSFGGTGKAFDWRQIKGVNKKLGLPIILAGGLTPENIGEAIEQAAPDGVDISGGVETDGQKDIEKIARFIEMARAAERGTKDAG